MKSAILIGGKSSRMGRPKALLDAGGGTLSGRLCQLLTQRLGEAPWLLGSGPFDASAPHQGPLPDRPGTLGPLAGLLALFDSDPDQDYLVLAVDLPCMSMAALDWIIAQPRDSVAALWPRQPHMNHGEPLAGIYNRSARALLETAWSQGKVSPCQAIPSSARREPEIPERLRQAFINANRPEEWEAAERLLRGDALAPHERDLVYPRKACGLHGGAGTS